MRKILTAVPDEEAAKSDAEENDRCNIDRGKSACPKTGQDFLQRDHCANDRYMSCLPESKHISTGFRAWVVSCPKLGHHPGLTPMAEKDKTGVHKENRFVYFFIERSGSFLYRGPEPTGKENEEISPSPD